MPSDYVKDLVDHKQRVAGHMQTIANDLFRRATIHDNSKFSPEEFEAYEAAFPELQHYAYGTEEFKAALSKIKPAIQHHYASNDHHPEHFESGIEAMTLVQLIEMLCDWLAVSERSQTSFLTGLEMNQERFHIDDQLAKVLKNTVERYDPQKLLIIDPPV
jgi:hypothetical protein